MSDLVTKFAPYTDEIFKAESKTSLLTNTDFDWSGANTVKVYKISTASLSDYGRHYDSGDSGVTLPISRYGDLLDLSATTETFQLQKDRSFIFNIDKADRDETAEQLAAASALARELREVVVPEVDSWVYAKMAAGAGTKADAASLTKSNIYGKILDGSETLDDNEVPEVGRVLVVCPSVYNVLKQAISETAYSDVAEDLRAKGVVAMLDGMAVVRVPSARLPENFGFMIAHPSATVAPVKLEDYNIHQDTPLSSGDVVTGRIIYGAYVLANKNKGIYYQALPAASGGSGN
ncbi:MAG: hypothetical protein J5647_00060 [Spirochaetaceae bacterium]|nr:hypothetical protein [Spirochaetaceae bacterium]